MQKARGAVERQNLERRRMGPLDPGPVERARAIKRELRRQGRRFDDSTEIIRRDRSARS